MFVPKGVVVYGWWGGGGDTGQRTPDNRFAPLPPVKLIVGLGNPGSEYAKSRHNVGWMIADAFAAKFRIKISKHEKEAMTGSGRVAGGAVGVAKPLTDMNRSGDAGSLLANAYTQSPP